MLKEKKSEKLRVWALVLVIGLPVFFILTFRGLKKIPRPKTPQPMFTDSLEVKKNLYGEIDTLAVYHRIPNLKFETQFGDTLELDSLKGKLYIANFFFASCPGICPKMTSSMAKVQEAFAKDEVIRLVSFTVDPERDNPEVLREYANRHQAIPGKWFFLRGSKEQTYALAEKGFKLTAIADAPDEIEKIAHSERFVLVDWNGHIRGYYPGTDSARIVKLSQDAFMIKREYERGQNYSFGRSK